MFNTLVVHFPFNEAINKKMSGKWVLRWDANFQKRKNSLPLIICIRIKLRFSRILHLLLSSPVQILPSYIPQDHLH
jgi:hypothetical protein